MRTSTTLRGRELLAVVAILVAVLSTACSGQSPPAAHAPALTTSADSPPQVERPLDATATADAPCERLLSPVELHQFGISAAGRPRTYGTVDECAWTSTSDDRLRIGVVTTRDLLADTYRSVHSPVFEPTTVEGYPAVRQRTSPSYNTCDVTLGLGGKQALETDWTGSAPVSRSVDPCARAEQAMALVIRKLPPQK